MKGNIKNIVLMGVVILFCFLPRFSICPFEFPLSHIDDYFVLWLKLIAYFIAAGIVGYSLSKVSDRRLCVGYITIAVLYIVAFVMMGMLSIEISILGSFMDTYGVELWLICLLSLLVMLGYAGIDKLVTQLSGREWNFNLSRCFIVMSVVPVILWHINYWVNGFDGFVVCNFVTLYVARVFGVFISGLVAGRMLGDCRVNYEE